MQETFHFRLQTNTYCGFGWSENIGSFLKDKGAKRVLILADEGCAKTSGYFNEIQKNINDNTNSFDVLFIRGTEEPDYDYLDEVAEKVRQIDCPDLIIGIGGGSCLDITKAVAVLVVNSGKGIEYRGFDKVRNPGIPTLAIPTTAGTGSEVTINAVFTDKQEMKKLGINGRYMNATYAILDAKWTLSCPVSVAVSAGMDALTHALESFACRQHNSITRMYSKEAFRLLYQNLPSILEDPENEHERQNILLGSHLAAIALFNSGSGIAGALSYPIGVHFKVPHGMGGAIFLASVIEYNVSNGYTDYAELLDLIEADSGLSLHQKSICFSERLRVLAEHLGVPRYLNDFGISKVKMEDIASLMRPLQAAFDQNPIPFSAETNALDILQKHVRLK